MAHSLLAQLHVIRRIAALLTMVAILGLALVLMWQVQLHRHPIVDDTAGVRTILQAA